MSNSSQVLRKLLLAMTDGENKSVHVTYRPAATPPQLRLTQVDAEPIVLLWSDGLKCLAEALLVDGVGIPANMVSATVIMRIGKKLRAVS